MRTCALWASLMLGLHATPRAISVEIAETSLFEYRLKLGQNENGGPFYISSPAFDNVIVQIKAMELGSEMSSKALESLHLTFLRDGHDQAIWEGWGQVCEIVQALSEIRGCIDAPSPTSGWRATHASAMNGELEKLQWLARNGANVNLATGPNTQGLKQTGFAPAHLAAISDNVQVLEVLERAGADLFKKAPGGYTPLDVAIEKGSENAARFLRSKTGDRSHREL